jgi:hypothetical protein
MSGLYMPGTIDRRVDETATDPRAARRDRRRHAATPVTGAGVRAHRLGPR